MTNTELIAQLEKLQKKVTPAPWDMDAMLLEMEAE